MLRGYRLTETPERLGSTLNLLMFCSDARHRISLLDQKILNEYTKASFPSQTVRKPLNSLVPTQIRISPLPSIWNSALASMCEQNYFLRKWMPSKLLTSQRIQKFGGLYFAVFWWFVGVFDWNMWAVFYKSKYLLFLRKCLITIFLNITSQ